MTATTTQDVEYQRYLTEAQAEVDALLAPATTPDPEPDPASPVRDALVKVVIVAILAAVVFLVGALLFRGRRPVRSMA